ncbi:hypothetical protein [Sinorhizobium medicae]|uniref:hypothetical protein n=1 Tax=Sinorhizobium medicae TaxID=110321 RepID=UPI000427C8D6|nr:hypothetical protein [Sinorhizobium medicae]
MRNITPALFAAIAQARETGLVPRSLVYVTAKNRATGQPESVGVWSDREDANITVLGGTNGLPVTRLYHGGGALLDVSEIPRVSDLTIQTVTIGLSQLAGASQRLIREYDVRLAKVEIHQVLIDPKSGQLVSVEAPVFLGEVDGAPVRTPSIGGEGSIELKVVSDAISMLTRTNPRKSSYEAQKRRQGDEWGLYSGTIQSWQIPWGQKDSAKQKTASKPKSFSNPVLDYFKGFGY